MYESFSRLLRNVCNTKVKGICGETWINPQTSWGPRSTGLLILQYGIQKSESYNAELRVGLKNYEDRKIIQTVLNSVLDEKYVYTLNLMW